MKLYHGSYEATKPTVKLGVNGLGGIVDNVFDGLFASTDEGVAYAHGEFLHVYEVNKVAVSSDLDEPEALVLLAKESFSEGEDLSILLDCIISEKWNNNLEIGNLKSRSTAYDRDDEASIGWELQRLRGRIAAHLGYDAVECEDEHGTSYLIVNHAE